MFRSLRWRLQAWQALILLLVVGGFASVLYFQIRQARFAAVDGELLAGARVLEGSLRGFPPHVLNDGFDGPDGYRPRPPDGKHERPPWPKGPPREHLEQTLSLPGVRADRQESGNDVYFAIWLGNGTLLKKSADTLNVPSPGEPLAPELAERVRVRQRGSLREVIVMGPARSQVLVGQSIEPVLADLDRLLGQLAVTGFGVIGIGLVGGWWLARRIIQPIEAMSTTAASISAANLSRRIATADVDNELSRLGEILNAMFARLENAFEQQVRFTADASHELRTPLSILLSHTELALSRPRSEPEYRETLQTCLRAAQRMRHLVDDLLMLARADAGKLELRSERLDLHRLAAETAAFLQPLAAERGIRVAVAGTTAWLQGDPDRLARVATNLINNAIHYNRPNGSVTASVAAAGADVVLTVADTGVGIAEADRHHIFERFYRVDKARSRESGGNGLGLAICKSIVEAHGGTIAVASELGKGTTFTVRLPLASRERERLEGCPPPLAHAPGSLTIRVENGRETVRWRPPADRAAEPE